jgi:putative tricarboxylic transport membrane protein
MSVGMGGLTWLAVAAVAMVEGVRLGVGTPRQPGPGFFPVVVALALAGLATALLLQQPVEEAPRRQAAGGRGRFAATVVALLAYAVLLEPLGFVPTTFIVMWFLAGFVGQLRWSIACPFGVVTAVSAWFLFDRLLHAQLPRGVLALLGP